MINEILQWGFLGAVFLFANHNGWAAKGALNVFGKWQEGQDSCLDHLHEDVERLENEIKKLKNEKS